MWPFKKDLDISELQEVVSKLEREFQTLQLEWVNFYDKALRMMQRMAKRAETVERASSTFGGDFEVPSSSPFPLSPAQQRLQHQILARRRQMSPKINGEDQ
jgi:hypothetical protein